MRLTSVPIVLAVPLVLVGCSGEHPTAPGIDGQGSPWIVAFQSDRTGNGDLYAVDPDDPAAVWPLADSEAVEFAPRWIASEHRLVHAVDDGTGVALVALQAPGGPSTLLCANPAGGDVPDRSPDGTRMVWPWGDPGSRDLVVSEPDGTDPVQLTHFHGDDVQPSWSPDGGRIAFVSDRSGNPDIWVVSVTPDGRTSEDAVDLTRHPAVEGRPTWSPDGRVLFYRHENGDADLWLVDPETGTTTRRTDTPGDEFEGSFSPDGSRIAFVSNRDGNPEIYVMDADGDDVVRLTHHEGIDGDPRWIPRRFVDPEEGP